METTQNPQTGNDSNRRLERPKTDRVLGGVAAGIANHTGASVGLIRLGFLVAALFGGLGVLLYVAAWALIPDAGSDGSPAEAWLANLTTPGKRLGAFLIGIAGLIVVTGAAPITILAAVALLAGAALLANDRPAPAAATTTASSTGETPAEPNHETE